MSEPIDDKALDEYLSGRSQISQRYRALADDARETVPPELDRRILAQARAAIAQAEVPSMDELTRLRTKRRRLMQWGVPAALAASAVLVISIVIQGGVQHEVRAVTERPMKAPAAAAPPAPPIAAKQQSTGASAQDGVVLITPPQNAVTEFSPLAPPPAEVAKEAPRVRRIAPSPPPARAPLKETSKSEQAAVAADTAAAGASRVHVPNESAPTPMTAMQARQSAAPSATLPQAPAPAAMTGDERSGPADLRGDPQRWLEHIRKLRKNGKDAEADSDWKEFRARYPDYPVAETDAAAGKPESKP